MFSSTNHTHDTCYTTCAQFYSISNLRAKYTGCVTLLQAPYTQRRWKNDIISEIAMDMKGFVHYDGASITDYYFKYQPRIFADIVVEEHPRTCIMSDSVIYRVTHNFLVPVLSIDENTTAIISSSNASSHPFMLYVQSDQKSSATLYKTLEQAKKVLFNPAEPAKPFQTTCA